MATVTMKQLLEAGVHFGHQTRRWNPKMKSYIFTERNGIYIIDLQKTVKLMDAAYNFVRDVVAGGGSIVFVGTKKQAQESIKVEAERCGMHYVNQRWLGGMLTNFKTIRNRIDRMIQLEKMETDGTFDRLPKKEVLMLRHEHAKLLKFLGGIRNMTRLPDAIYVVDPRKEKIAVAEARSSIYPLSPLLTRQHDPDEIDHIIPGNDDAIRAVVDHFLHGRRSAGRKEQPDMEEASRKKQALAKPVLAKKLADGDAGTAKAKAGGEEEVQAADEAKEVTPVAVLSIA